MQVSVIEIAKLLDGEVIGDGQLTINGISGLTEAKSGDISFLANPKYAPFLQETGATAVIVASAQEVREGLAQIVVSNPDWAFARVVQEYGPQAKPVDKGVHPTAIIGDNVELGEDIAIGPYVVVGDNTTIANGVVLHAQVVIGNDAKIGAESILYPHSTVREMCVIGERAIIHSGAVIGSDGFGYATVSGVHHKIPQVGIVVIGDDVEIGANTTIDRARFGVTSIGNGTKVDNLVQIAHNVEIGEHCFVVSQVGIAGSTKIGNHVTLAGQSGINGHIKIGDGTIVAARSGVSKSIAGKTVVQGQPAQDIKQHQAREIAVRRLPKLQQQLKQLSQRVAELESEISGLLAERVNSEQVDGQSAEGTDQ